MMTAMFGGCEGGMGSRGKNGRGGRTIHGSLHRSRGIEDSVARPDALMDAIGWGVRHVAVLPRRVEEGVNNPHAQRGILAETYNDYDEHLGSNRGINGMICARE